MTVDDLDMHRNAYTSLKISMKISLKKLTEKVIPNLLIPEFNLTKIFVEFDIITMSCDIIQFC